MMSTTDVTKSFEDNIADPTPEENSIKSPNPPQEIKNNTGSNPVTQPNEFTLAQACQAINRHFARGAKNMKFVAPFQFVDGGICEFIDEESGNVLATARLRFRNGMHVDKGNGQMLIPAYLSDIAYSREYLNVSFSK